VWRSPCAPSVLRTIEAERHTRAQRQEAGVASLKLSIDAPSPLTGTGEALVADGEDTAMIRATLLDKNGQLAAEAMDEVVFKVASGEGRLW
jgi:hypothetical protein